MLLVQINAHAQTDSSPSPSPTSTPNGPNVRADTPAAAAIVPAGSPPPEEGLLQNKPTAGQKSDTYQFLNKRDNPNPTMQQNAQDFESGKSRAQQMVTMLQNQELTKAFQKITNSGMKTLDENHEIRDPLAVIGGAMALWYGKSVKLIKGDDYNLSARMEGRSQKGEFSMNSPLLNGNLKYEGMNGMGVGVNRIVSPLQTMGSVQYNVRNQLMTTEVRQKIAPNLDLSFGASRLDQSTKIEYRLNF